MMSERAPVRIEMMKCPEVDALVAGLQATDPDIRVEDVGGGMIHISGAGRIYIDADTFARYYGEPYNLKDLNVYTVTIVGYTRQWDESAIDVGTH